MMKVIYEHSGEYLQDFVKYKGNFDPRQHLQECEARWNREGVSKELWVHEFIDTLGTFPKAWYVKEETRR